MINKSLQIYSSKENGDILSQESLDFVEMYDLIDFQYTEDQKGFNIYLAKDISYDKYVEFIWQLRKNANLISKNDNACQLLNILSYLSIVDLTEFSQLHKDDLFKFIDENNLEYQQTGNIVYINMYSLYNHEQKGFDYLDKSIVKGVDFDNNIMGKLALLSSLAYQSEPDYVDFIFSMDLNAIIDLVEYCSNDSSTFSVRIADGKFYVNIFYTSMRKALIGAIYHNKFSNDVDVMKSHYGDSNKDEDDLFSILELERTDGFLTLMLDLQRSCIDGDLMPTIRKEK